MFHKRRQSRKSGLNCTDKCGYQESGEACENMRMMKTTVLVMITRVMRKKMVEDKYDSDVLND